MTAPGPADAPRSAANIAYARIRANRAAEYSKILSALRQDQGSSARSDQTERALTAHVASTSGSDFYDDALRQSGDVVRRAMLAAGIADLPQAGPTFGVISSPEAWAEFSRHHDESGLILVSEGLIGLMTYLGNITGVWVGELMGQGGNFRRARYLAQQQRGTHSDLIKASIAAVRYYLLHQRFHGVSAQLKPLPGEYETLASNFSGVAWYFVVAHELGHYAMAHPTGRLGFTQSEPLHLIPESQALEFAADKFAVDVMQYISGYDTGKPISATNIWGSLLIAMSAISLSEGSLMLRRARTHPSVAARLEALKSAFPTKSRRAAVGMFSGANEILSANLSMHTRVPAEYWTLLQSETRISKFSKSSDYLTAHQMLDDILTSDTSTLMHGLRNQPGAEALLKGVEHASASNAARSAFDVWGLEDTELLFQPGTSLAFHTVMKAILDAEVIGKGEASATLHQKVAAATAVVLLDRVSRWEDAT